MKGVKEPENVAERRSPKGAPSIPAPDCRAHHEPQSGREQAKPFSSIVPLGTRSDAADDVTAGFGQPGGIGAPSVGLAEEPACPSTKKWLARPALHTR
jgi:hypothetical protein